MTSNVVLFTYVFASVPLLVYSRYLVFSICSFCPWAHAVLLPEVVARDQGLIGILVIQAAEAVFGTTAMGPAVQVTVPVDLNAHDSSIGGKSTRRVMKPVRGYAIIKHSPTQ